MLGRQVLHLALQSPPLVRRVHSSLPRLAAAAAAPAPVRRFVRKAAVPASGAPRAPAPTAPAPSTAAPEYDDVSELSGAVDEFPLPETDIDDYAHLRPAPPLAPTRAPARSAAPATPSVAGGLGVSPPLTRMPDASYAPLPSALEMSGATAIQGIEGEARVGDDWSTSFRGLSEKPFDKEIADALLRPLEADDVEIKPDGLLYLPEIKYRRTLNAAFGPGGWGMAPRGETHVGPRIVSREWGLVCLGRLVGIARGEQEFFDPSGIPTATEACKSNALMRCCKDLGIASELWDPRFIRKFKEQHCVEVMVEHVTQKKKRKLWRKKNAKFDYPYKELK